MVLDMLRHRLQRDSGFTLIEMILSIAILGVIMSALVGLMFASMTADRKTKSRLDGTRDEQFTAVYFAGDVQGATNVVAGVSARCGSGTAVIEFRGASYDPATLADKITVVSYVFTTPVVDGVPTGRLERRSCEAPALPAPTYPLASSVSTVMARTLSAAAPVPTCTPAPCGTTTRSVSLALARLGADTGFTLIGTRRSS
jgi:prepilin-type N-terminal cleavage/methylation domain-containing protein